MLTCVACPGAASTTFHDEDDDTLATPSTRHALKSLSSHLKDMALKASGAYRQCKPCSRFGDAAEGFRYEYRRAGESSSSTPGKEVRSGEATPSMSGRTETGVVLVEEEMSKEWVAQVEPGVLITFLPLPHGGNDLKRIHFSREMFNKWQAQRWWAENNEKVTELYNVQRYNHQAVPLPTPPRSEDEKCKLDPAEVGPVTPPLTNERLPRNFNKIPTSGGGIGYSSSESHDHNSLQSHHDHATVPKLSGISGAKTERSSMDASVRTTSSSHEADRSGELSISNASDQETEWVEQDEPGVYITIRALPDGVRELRRVRFSRERFGEMHARLWWEENRARIHEQYL